MARSNEPFWWVPFMAGAGLSAFFMPATLVITGIAVGLGWIDEARMRDLLNNGLVQVYLGVLISLSLFHAAHRLRFVLMDLLTARGALAFLCYGSAVAGTVTAVLLLIRL